MAEKGTIIIPITLVAEGGGSVTDGVESVGGEPSMNDSDKTKKKPRHGQKQMQTRQR